MKRYYKKYYKKKAILEKDIERIKKMGESGSESEKELAQTIIDFYKLLEKIIEEREDENNKKG